MGKTQADIIIKSAVFFAVFLAAVFTLQVFSEPPPKTEIKSESVSFEDFSNLKFDITKRHPFSFESRDSLRLADQKKEDVFVSSTEATPFKFNAIGVYWTEETPQGSAIKVELRLKNKDGWDDWRLAGPDDADQGKDPPQKSKRFSDLIFLSGAESFQYRVTLKTQDPEQSPSLDNIGFNYIDSTNGPKVAASKGVISEANAQPSVISRAGWGSPEPYSSPNWPPEYEFATHSVIHHTAGGWNTSDPAATVRAIWQYHAITRGWGDIGYNYLIDGYGNIYEGRYGGENVVAGHAFPYNRGTIGISVMGDYTSSDISSAARSALADLMAKKFADRNINPLGADNIYAKYTVGGGGTVDAWGRSSVWAPRILGHRDVAPTGCPGNVFYSTLGDVRNLTASKYPLYVIDIKVSSFSISPLDPSMAEEVTANFSVTNQKAETSTLDTLTVAVRYNEPAFNIRDFPGLSNVSLAPGETKSFTLESKFNDGGNYKAWVSVRKGSTWINPSSSGGIPSSINFQVHGAQVKVTTSLSITPPDPLINQSVTASFTVKNYDSHPAIFPVLGVALRLNPNAGFFPKDFEWKLVTIPAGGVYTYSSTQVLKEAGSYLAYVSALYPDGYWRWIEVSSSGIVNSLNFKTGVNPADLKITGSLNINPQGPIINQPVEASFKVKNFGEQTYVGIIGTALRFDPNNSFLNKDFAWKEVIIPGGAEYSYTDTKNLTETGEYRAYISQYKNGSWQSILPASGSIIDLVNFNAYNSPEDPKVVTSLSIAPADPVSGSQVTASFKVKNFGDRPAVFPALGVALRLNEPAWNPRDFEWKPVTINGGQEYTYSSTQTLTELGNYRAFISSYYKGVWQGVQTQSGVATEKSFSVSSVAEKIKVSSFTVSTNNPSIGEEVTFNLGITNTSAANITIDALGVAVRYNEPTWNPKDFGYQKVTILGGETKTIEIRQRFNEIGRYRAWIAYTVAGAWYNPSSLQGNWLNQNLETHIPIVKVKSFSITPQEPEINTTTTASFTVKNYDSHPAVFNALGVALRYNPNAGFYPKDFEWKLVTIPAGGEYTYSSAQILTEPGPYLAFVSSLAPDGVWRPMEAEQPSTSATTFTAYRPPDPKIIASLSISPANPIVGSQVTATFKVKNFGDKPAISPALGVALRLNEPAWNPRDFEWKSVTIPAGQEYTYSSTQALTELGNYRAFISSYVNNSWNAGYPPLYSSNLAREAYFNVVSHLSPTVSVSGISGDYNIVSNGQVLATKNIWNETFVSYYAGKYYVTAPFFATVSNSYIRLEPVGGTIMQINSYNDLNWNGSANYNRFRGAIEIRYSGTSNALWAINELPLESYLKGIAEATSGHIEYLKSMAVSARSYAYWHILRGGKHAGEPFDLKNSRQGNGNDQVYAGYSFEELAPQVTQAVNLTSRQVVSYPGYSVAITPYSHGAKGWTRAGSTIGLDYPWLPSVDDPWGDPSAGYQNPPGNHLVGLSASGAKGYAENGSKHNEILGHYFVGTSLASLDEPMMRVAIYKIQY